MKKVTRTIIIFLIALVFYLGGIGFYSNKFQANTSFASIDVSNLSLVKAEEKIHDEYDNKVIELVERGQSLGSVKLGELDGEFRVDKALENVYKSQEPTKWVKYFFKGDKFDVDLASGVQVDPTALSNKLTELGLSNEGRIKPQDASIEFKEGQGYHVEVEQLGTTIDISKLSDLLVNAISNNESTVDISNAYEEPAVKADDERITTLMDKIDKVASSDITLEIAGNEEKITPEQIMEWIYFDSSNDIVINEAAVKEYVSYLNDKYATFNKPRQYESTLQGTVTVQPGTLGWSISSDDEVPALIRDLKSGNSVKREPNIVGTGYNIQGDDIGLDRIEVDLTYQTMFLYLDGSLVIETPIVSGLAGVAETIPGAYAVWDKQSPSVLKGERAQDGYEYEQPVEYWLPFDGTGQGIHDANWQGTFGGSVYVTGGSQGCINTPPAVMAQLYDLVYIGIPVIVFN